LSACCPCYFSSVAPLFGSDVPHNTLEKSSNHSYSMCVLSLHMPLQSFMAIGSNVEEIWSYLFRTVPAAPQQSSSWLACIFLMLHHSSDCVLQPQCVLYCCTCLWEIPWP
jgi:hypothetical protein